MRNLDMTALRSFMTIADAGGVTRAAGMLNLTQSAVSMQMKRLEDMVGTPLLDRSARTIALTAAGEQLLGYARRIIALNDEAWHRLTATDYEGELQLGVPHDVIYPAVPQLLRRFAKAFPRMKVKLVSAPTRTLLAMFGRGEVDLIITTEAQCGPGGIELVELPLLWVGAKDGVAWRQRPLPVAFCSNCIFRSEALQALSAHGVEWNLTVDTDSDNAAEAAVSADLAVNVALPHNLPPHTAVLNHGGALPPLRPQKINLYVLKSDDPVSATLAQMVSEEYSKLAAPLSISA